MILNGLVMKFRIEEKKLEKMNQDLDLAKKELENGLLWWL